jgi:hypothetical protein
VSPDEGIDRDCPSCGARWEGDRMCHSTDCDRWPMVKGHEKRAHRASGEGGSTSALRASIPSGAEAKHLRATLRYIGDAASDFMEGAGMPEFSNYEWIVTECRAALACQPQAETVVESAATQPTPEGISAKEIEEALFDGCEALACAQEKVPKYMRWMVEAALERMRVPLKALIAARGPQADAKAIPSPAPQAPPPEGIDDREALAKAVEAIVLVDTGLREKPWQIADAVLANGFRRAAEPLTPEALAWLAAVVGRPSANRREQGGSLADDVERGCREWNRRMAASTDGPASRAAKAESKLEAIAILIPAAGACRLDAEQHCSTHGWSIGRCPIDVIRELLGAKASP